MSVLYFWKLLAGDLTEAQHIVEQLRLRAVELGWEPVDEVLHLSDDAVLQDDRLPKRFLLIGTGETALTPNEVVFFMACAPGDESQAFGLAAYPRFVEGQAEVTPTHLGSWSWVGVVRSMDLRSISNLMHVAAELGIEVTMSCAGMQWTARKNDQGEVEWDQRCAIDENF